MIQGHTSLQAQSKSLVYVTDKCVEPDTILLRGRCAACPRGAECPGGGSALPQCFSVDGIFIVFIGGRAWPHAGFWTTHELSGFVASCAPPETHRCLGGRFSDCGPGYSGTLCSQCKPEHYIDTGKCVRCNPAETKITVRANTAFKLATNSILFITPFWLLIQLRGMFLGVGGIVAIVGGATFSHCFPSISNPIPILSHRCNASFLIDVACTLHCI